MEIKDLIQVFNQVLNADGKLSIDENTEFKELDSWSSLSAFNIVAIIAEKYDIRIKGIDIRRCKNITELYNIIKK